MVPRAKAGKGLNISLLVPSNQTFSIAPKDSLILPSWHGSVPEYKSESEAEQDTASTPAGRCGVQVRAERAIRSCNNKNFAWLLRATRSVSDGLSHRPELHRQQHSARRGKHSPKRRRERGEEAGICSGKGALSAFLPGRGAASGATSLGQRGVTFHRPVSFSHLPIVPKS